MSSLVALALRHAADQAFLRPLQPRFLGRRILQHAGPAPARDVSAVLFSPNGAARSMLSRADSMSTHGQEAHSSVADTDA
eukprot:388436-Rhodomonas_salina.1